MKSRLWLAFTVSFGFLFTVGTVGIDIRTCKAVEVVLVAPKTLYHGVPGTVSLTTVRTSNYQPVGASVKILLKDNSGHKTTVFTGRTSDEGRLRAQFPVPDVEPGAYNLIVKVKDMKTLTAPVQVRTQPVLLIETDKPIYKPGQTIQGRILVLKSNLTPSADASVSVEITDGKGIKIFRKMLTANAFGVAPFELDLASELNFGTWKIKAESGSATGMTDVRVEKYILPRFEVKLITENDYVLVKNKITGTVSAKYFFGKNVDGTVVIHAKRYVGVWEEFATFTGQLTDGQVEFELPAVEYATGTTGSGGAGTCQLDVTVTDTSGHEEKSTRLLKVLESTIQHQLIAQSRILIPGQPFELLLTAETPDGKPVDVVAALSCHFYNESGNSLDEVKRKVAIVGGSAETSFDVPEETAWMQLDSVIQKDGEKTEATLQVNAAYSPSDSFLALKRASAEAIKVGDEVVVDVFKTHNATVYYDVFANGHTVWSDATDSAQIIFQATAQMVPAAKIVAYIINPNNEISADALPLEVNLANSTNLAVEFNAEEVLPGDAVQLSIQAEGQSMVGLSLVDESVYALNQGRLNMQQVFNELERILMEPQAEVHPDEYSEGVRQVFADSGLQIITTNGFEIPEGRHVWPWPWFWRGGDWKVLMAGATDEFGPPENGGGEALAEVNRIRQFFPETWLWMPELLTDADGTATLDLTAPDSITTWRLHAVSTSAQGLGIADSQLRVFQEFFGEPDLPYAVTRNEQFPVRVQVYNYVDEGQNVQVELEGADWFDLLGESRQIVEIAANSVGSASFLIQPIKTGRYPLKVTLRSPLRADAVIREVLVEPEGTRREIIRNGMIATDETVKLDSTVPDYCVADSARVLLSICPSLVAQSINGVDDLLNMPYGCGEQNMIFMAPDIEVLRYLDATGQLVPEVRAKAEHFITVGYQRELTYRHDDGSFSAFGNSDKSGSLWLTAFVLDVFSEAREVTSIDETILSDAVSWIKTHQLADGSWDTVGFLCHQDMKGGLEGKYALTAFVAIALADYGQAPADMLEKATQYLSDNLSGVWDDPYALAVAGLAFSHTQHNSVNIVLDRLLELGTTDEQGIHWEPYAVETTAYAALAMIEQDYPQSGDVIKWISLQQNSQGGFGNTQDTVMGLKALMTAARVQSRDINLNITARGLDENGKPTDEILAEFAVDSTNFDVLQTVELPADREFELSAAGTGKVKYQLVRRYNVLLDNANTQTHDMAIEVNYDADHVEVNDIVTVKVTVRYFGLKDSTGMMIVDVGVPTGFAPVTDSLEALLDSGAISRYEIAGRKVILYVDDMSSGESRSFQFQVKARFPVRAIIPDSKVYAYYEPEIRAEASGKPITVGLTVIGQPLYCLNDFVLLAHYWLSDCGAANEECNMIDLDDSGSIDMNDLLLLSNKWLSRKE